MKLFKNGIAGWSTIHALTHPWLIVDYYYREIKYGIQRARRGYSDRDNWSIDGFLVSILPRMLKNLRRNTHSYPMSLTVKKWEKILIEMEEGFKANQRLCNLEYDFKDKHATKLLKQASYKALLLFIKYFNDLWD